jgi:uncharacterized protein (DUF433 family)
MRVENYIEESSEIMMGKPVIKSTRITVEHILKKLSEGASAQEIIEMYPRITSTQIQACIEMEKSIKKKR